MAEKQEAKNVKKAKRNIIIAAVLLFVCAAVYLNWSYNNSPGAADPAMVKVEDEQMSTLGTETGAEAASDYFALNLLQTAASSESASQETIDSAMNAIAAMANWSMLETQLENTLLAKNFSDCVVYISDEGVTVSVPAPAEGLSEAAVARITEAVTSAGYTADQLHVIEIRSGQVTEQSPTEPDTDAGTGTGTDTDTGTGTGTGEDSET